jgi:RNA polymerase sigma factor (sigma-70 family)
MRGKRPVLREFQRLYERDFHKFVRVARAITGDPQSALDAVHDGFAAAIRGRDGYRGDGPFEAWVWRIVVNAARKVRAARSETLPLAAAAAVEVGEDPEVEQLASVLTALPERQRTIVFLRHYADLDYRSIAATLEIEIGTVGAALSVAHQSIRMALQEVKTHG